MKITKRQLRRIIREEKANLKESRDDERFKSYRGVTSEPSDTFPNARIGHDKLNNPEAIERVMSAIDSIELVEEYIRNSVSDRTPGFNEGGPVYNALRHAKDELEALARGK